MSTTTTPPTGDIARQVSAEDLAALRAAVRGPVLTPDDAALAAEVATFNLAVRHRPTVVIGPTSADDVVAAVRWAGALRLPVAVQATGHGPMQPVERAVLVTTGRMRTVEVDPGRRTAQVGAGARWADVLGEAEPHGLTGVAGSSSQVGVVGYSVGGGMGPLGRRHGYGADLVRRVEIVTADGRLRQVDAERDPDLFWAVRGGKGNFGVVTSMEIDLVPVPSLFAGAVFLSGSDAAAVLHSFRTWAPTLPERASTSVALLNMPPFEGVPDALRGRYVVMLRFALDGTDAEGDALLAPMREAGQCCSTRSAASPRPRRTSSTRSRATRCRYGSEVVSSPSCLRVCRRPAGLGRRGTGATPGDGRAAAHGRGARASGAHPQRGVGA